MTSLEPIGLFLVYFGVGLAFEAVFLVLYMAATSHHEATLIKQGNTAAAISLSGAVLGFTLPLGSVIIHSVSLLDMAVWSLVALLVQIVVYRLADFLLRDISRHIEEGNTAAAATLAAASLAIGMINAASMTY